MHYLHALEKAIQYIENHLLEEIDLSFVAKEAGYSLYHFHRIFKMATGDSIKDYIRKRRMTEAAKELAYTDTAVVDIGMKYGYQSREAFSRAFEKIYGRNPSDVRKNKLLHYIREPLTFNYLMFKYNLGKERLTPIFRKLPKRHVIGKKTTLQLDGSHLQDIPLLWHQWHLDQDAANIPKRKYEHEFMGICIPSDGDVFDYMIGHEVESTQLVTDHIPEHMSLYTLEPTFYAVFTTLGPITESVQKTWDYIYSVWLTNSDYEHAGTHDIEYYYYNQGELKADLYLSILPKS